MFSHRCHITGYGLVSMDTQGNPSDMALDQAGFEELSRIMRWNVLYSRVVNDVKSAMQWKVWDANESAKPHWYKSLVYDSTQLYCFLQKELGEHIQKISNVRIQGIDRELLFENNKAKVEIYNRLDNILCGDLIKQVHLGGIPVTIQGKAELWFRGKEEGCCNSQWVKFMIPIAAYNLEFDGLNYQLMLDIDRINWGE